MWVSVVGERAEEGRDTGLSERWEAEKGCTDEGVLEWIGERIWTQEILAVSATACQIFMDSRA